MGTEKTSLLIHTGLEHNIRNVINGVTPDVIVVFGGSRGTLAEAAFALAAGKKLLFFSGQDGGGVVRLRKNFEKYFKKDSMHQDYMNTLLLPSVKSLSKRMDKYSNSRKLTVFVVDNP